MSRALAAADRVESDAYFTPDAVAVACVGLLRFPVGAVVWEPHAGGGAFVRALAARGARVAASDLTERPWPEATWTGQGDFLTIDTPGCPSPSWIVGNPPFRRFEDHLDHALASAYNVAFLLRVAAMETAARVPAWRRWPLRRVTVLAERPSFSVDGRTDTTAYGWFEFERGWKRPAVIVPGWSWRPKTETTP